MKVIRSEKPDNAARTALKEALAGDVSTLFLSSGGSCIGLLTSEILPHDCSKLTVSVLDEHYIEDESDRNFEKLRKAAFFVAATERGAGSFDPYGGAVEEAGYRFERFLKEWLNTRPRGRLRRTVGIGADGHTMGIVPFTER